MTPGEVHVVIVFWEGRGRYEQGMSPVWPSVCDDSCFDGLGQGLIVYDPG